MSRMPSVGAVVDDVFRVEEELDHGNFGAVYKVTDLLEQRTLALKVLKPGPHDEEELRQRFEREARLIYSLRHPHVVQVFYYGQTDAQLPYMAMEYLQGTDLRDLLAHHGGLADALARRITIEALSALHCAHAMGIVHRDLKPANIYLVNDGHKGHVKVLDFGFAKALESRSNEEITNAGTLVGTPAYMSPELVHKKDVGPAADIYAMGLILAEMLLGKKVVVLEAIYDTILFQGSDKPIKLPKSLRSSPFEPIITKAIAKDLDDRYPSAVAMINDLRALDIAGVGPFKGDVPLGQAPPEVGTADTEANTRPRHDGRPSMTEIDAALHDPSYPLVDDLGDDEATIDRRDHPAPFTDQEPTAAPGHRPGQASPHQQAHRRPTHPSGHFATEGIANRADEIRAQAAHPLPQEGHQATPRPVDRGAGPSLTPEQLHRPSPVSAQKSSALKDIFFGIILGAILLATALYLHQLN